MFVVWSNIRRFEESWNKGLSLSPRNMLQQLRQKVGCSTPVCCAGTPLGLAGSGKFLAAIPQQKPLALARSNCPDDWNADPPDD